MYCIVLYYTIESLKEYRNGQFMPDIFESWISDLPKWVQLNHERVVKKTFTHVTYQNCFSATPERARSCFDSNYLH